MTKGDRILDRAIAADARMVVKRDGKSERFDLNKIVRTIALAFYDVRNSGAPNPSRDDPLTCYGLDGDTFAETHQIASSVSQMLEL